MLRNIRKSLETRMVDSVVIELPGSGIGSVDPVTLAHTPSAATMVYSGKAMYGDRLSGHPRQEGFADKREHFGVMRLPVEGSEAVSVDCRVTWQTGALAGEVWEVVGVLGQTFQATRRFEIYRKVAEVMES